MIIRKVPLSAILTAIAIAVPELLGQKVGTYQ